MLPINKSICRCFILIIIAIFYSTAIASANPFPTEEWPVSTPEAQGMQSQLLADMLEVIEKNSYKDNKCVYLATHTGPDPEKFAPIVESLSFE